MFANLLKISETHSLRISPHLFKDFCYISHPIIVAIMILFIKSPQSLFGTYRRASGARQRVALDALVMRDHAHSLRAIACVVAQPN